jgi:LL-diaminopimelate aminotransferase
MIENINLYYRETILDDTLSDFFTYEKIAKDSSTHDVLLDFGVAGSFCRPSEALLSRLKLDLSCFEAHGYNYGNDFFDEALLKWAIHSSSGSRNFHDWIVENYSCVITAGAKGGLNVIAQAYINEGDVILVTNPGYPVFKVQAERLGGVVIEIPLLASNNYMPDFSDCSAEILERAKLLLVNYPNNPTGKVLNQNEADTLLSFCIKHKIFLVNDAAYGNIVFDKRLSGSFLCNRNSLNNFIEIHSFSKSHQVPGWRLGYMVCNKEISRELRKIALMQNTGCPKFLLGALVKCLPHDVYLESLNRRIYSRLVCLASILNSFGFCAEVPNGTFFIYVKAPIGVKGRRRFMKTAQETAELFARHLGAVIIPFELVHEGYLRFSVAFSANDEEEYFSILKERLSHIEFDFA